MRFWLDVILEVIGLACMLALPVLLIFYYVAFGGTF